MSDEHGFEQWWVTARGTGLNADLGKNKCQEAFSAGAASRDAEVALTKSAMKELHDLTPGGSEFYNDPKRCADAIRSTRQTLMGQLVKSKAEIAALRAALEQVEWVKVHDGNEQYYECPWCKEWDYWDTTATHSPTCPRQLALGIEVKP